MKRRSEQNMHGPTGNLFAKMIAISLFSLLLFSLFSLPAPHVVYAQSMSGFKTYTLAEYGVVLQYPEDWNVEKVSGTEVDFTPPFSASDQGSPNVSFMVVDATGVESIEELTDELVAFYESFFVDFDIYESVSTKFGEYSGNRLVFFGTQGEFRLRIMQTYAIHEDKVYSLTYSALNADYPTYSPTVTSMISSFKIDTSIIPVQVSGTYSNEELGLKIDFPDGWNGIQNKNDNGTTVALVPADGRKLSMVLIAVNTSEYSAGGSQDPLSGCNTTSVRFDEINDMSTFSFDGECDRPEGFFIMKAYMFALDNRLVIAMLVAPSRTAFDSGVEEFDEAIQTLSLKNSVNVFSTLMYSLGKNQKNITGEYVNPEAGLSMRLPEGWNGFETVIDKSTSVMLFPPLTEKASVMITIDVIDKSSYKREYEVHVVGSIEYVTLNGNSALRADGEFEVQNMKLRSIGYILTTDDKVISVAYSAPTAEDYDTYKSEFGQSLQTLAIKDAVDVTTYVPLSVDFTESERTVTVDDKPYAVKVASTSNVTGILLNQEERQLSLALEGGSLGNGTSFITVSTVLEGPYIVTVDEAPADFDVLKDSGSNQTTIAVNHPRDTQSIVVAGTRVIPEFPLTMLSAIAIIVGLVIAMTKAKICRLPSGQ